MHILIELLVFDILTLYTFLYLLIYLSRKVQVPLDSDVFEDLKELRDQQGATTSDVVAAALQIMKREIAKRNATRTLNP